MDRNNLVRLLLVCFLGLPLGACGTNYQQAIVGTWQQKTWLLQGGLSSGGTTQQQPSHYTFEADGTLRITCPTCTPPPPPHITRYTLTGMFGNYLDLESDTIDYKIEYITETELAWTQYAGQPPFIFERVK